MSKKHVYTQDEEIERLKQTVYVLLDRIDAQAAELDQLRALVDRQRDTILNIGHGPQ